MYIKRIGSTAFHISDHMMKSIQRYVQHGVLPGSFLTAVICNDLEESYHRADAADAANVYAFVGYFHDKTPALCWGSAEKMEAWMKQKREEREKEESDDCSV